MQVCKPANGRCKPALQPELLHVAPCLPLLLQCCSRALQCSAERAPRDIHALHCHIDLVTDCHRLGWTCWHWLAPDLLTLACATLQAALFHVQCWRSLNIVCMVRLVYSRLPLPPADQP